MLLIAAGLHPGDGKEVAWDATFRSLLDLCLAGSHFAEMKDGGTWIVKMGYQIPGRWAYGKPLI